MVYQLIEVKAIRKVFI